MNTSMILHSSLTLVAEGILYKMEFQRKNEEYLKRSLSPIICILCHCNKCLFIIYYMPKLLKPIIKNFFKILSFIEKLSAWL